MPKKLMLCSRSINLRMGKLLYGPADRDFLLGVKIGAQRFRFIGVRKSRRRDPEDRRFRMISPWLPVQTSHIRFPGICGRPPGECGLPEYGTRYWPWILWQGPRRNRSICGFFLPAFLGYCRCHSKCWRSDG